jgi:hypothetical protein
MRGGTHLQKGGLVTGGEKKRPVIGGPRPRGETTIRQRNMILEVMK